MITTLNKLKVGELFILHTPKAKKIYIRGVYNRSIKKYEFTDYYDISSFKYRTGQTLVNTSLTPIKVIL
jgi:hypothetical protein